MSENNKVLLEDIRDIYQYWQKLKTCCNWINTECEPVEKAFKLLLKRCQDDCLYLGVVGEFSSGKSTFINALLGLDILKEDILPGTTCAPTMLCYGEEFDVEIHYNLGDKIIKFSDQKSCVNKNFAVILNKLGIQKSLQNQLLNAKTFIHRYTADESFAKDVSKVVLRLPCKNPIFDNGIVIVDTPGINVDNPRHQEATEAIVRDLCDLAIVLTPASNPGSQTLLSFIQEHLQSFLQHCICLISQIDRVRPKERQRQIKYIIEHFKCENINFSQIYPIAAYFAIHRDEDTSEEAKNFQEEFLQTMTKVCESLKRNKNIVLTEKVNFTLKYIINALLQPMLQKKTKEIQDRYEELQRNQLTDFSAFLSQWKCIAENNFSKGDVIKQYEIYDIATVAKRKLIEIMYQEIDNAETKDKLLKIISEENIKKHVLSIYNNYIRKEQSIQKECIRKFGDDFLEQFNISFNNEFRNLARHADIKIEAAAIKRTNKNVLMVSVMGGDKITTSINNNELVGEGLIIAGSVIGTFLCPFPVLGTVVGGAIGKVLSVIFGKSFETYREEAKDIIDKSAEKWCKELKKGLWTDIQNHYIAEQANINNAIDSFTQFQPEIKKIIEQENREQEKLHYSIKNTQNGLNYFQQWLDYLNNNK